MTDAEIQQMVAENNMVTGKPLGDGRYAAITPMTYGKFRLVIGSDPWGYEDGY